ncbi:hypothetical protein BK797_05150 [Kosakonia sacchari]|nr:hypothetical protein BK797_05150 [Kosakonia sacchari]
MVQDYLNSLVLFHIITRVVPWHLFFCAKYHAFVHLFEGWKCSGLCSDNDTFNPTDAHDRSRT